MDVAILITEESRSTHETHALWEVETSVVASRAFLETHGRPTSSADLRELNCVLSVGVHGRPIHSWPRLDGGTVAVHGSFASREVVARLTAARLGIGPALVPEQASQPLIERGELEYVLRDEIGSRQTCQLVHPHLSFVPPQLRAFVDYTVAYYRAAEELTCDSARLFGPAQR